MKNLNTLFYKLLKKIDDFVIRNFTVERGRNKRKYIWKTKNFREITQLYIPKLVFIGFVVIMCWKINDKVKKLKHADSHYSTKSKREEKVEEEQKEIDYFLSMPNEFDPDKVKNPIKVEYRDINKYEYNDLTDEELQKVEEFEEWIKEFKKS